jgi:solute carrier family 25 (mitochondrial phosphate transporter), member 23/24/25/41
MNFLSTSPGDSNDISFPEFRDFLILMPRKASTIEIYRYYQFRKFLGDDGHGHARVNMEGKTNRLMHLGKFQCLTLVGDVSLSAEDRHKADGQPPHAAVEDETGHDHHDNDVDKATAFKFLLAGGIAGAGSSFDHLSRNENNATT